MMRTVRLQNGRILKEFRRLAWPGDLRRPWRREHLALTRLEKGGVKAPRSFGIHRPKAGTITLEREYCSGEPVHALSAELVPALAHTFASMHACRVTMGDADLENLLRDDSGALFCIDYGRACTFMTKGLLYYFNVAKEIVRIRRRLFADRPELWQRFESAYAAENRYPAWARAVITTSTGYWKWKWKMSASPVLASAIGLLCEILPCAA